MTRKLGLLPRSRQKNAGGPHTTRKLIEKRIARLASPITGTDALVAWGSWLTDQQHRMDLLTALIHEMGHILGLDHDVFGVMQDILASGTRWTPSLDAADDYFAALGTWGKE